ncbi:MAG: recombinase family protein [Deltaproteobacteria bacterium]|nr:recombinase family protein [Deltaproteobacteria bacterium]
MPRPVPFNVPRDEAQRVCAVYLRVSTGEQKLSHQLRELRHEAFRRRWRITHIYRERRSAAKARPAWEDLREDARRRKFGAVLVWAMDRWARGGVAETLTSIEELDRSNVRFASLREPWADTDSPVRDLLLAVFGWVAQQERRRISERTRAGLDAARRRGVRLGRRPKDVDAELIDQVVAGHTSVRKAAAEAGVSRDAIRRRVREVQAVAQAQ